MSSEVAAGSGASAAVNVTLRPRPTTITGVGAATSARMPASLPLPTSTSLGHFRPATIPVTSLSASTTATPVASNVPRSAGHRPRRHRPIARSARSAAVRTRVAVPAAAGRLILGDQRHTVDIDAGSNPCQQVGVGGRGFGNHFELPPRRPGPTSPSRRWRGPTRALRVAIHPPILGLRTRAGAQAREQAPGPIASTPMTRVTEPSAEHVVDIHTTAGKLADLKRRTEETLHPSARPRSRRSTRRAS